MGHNVAIIGAGQLGSRYLQGLAKVSQQLQIQVFEPSAAARTVAAERFQAIEGSKDKTLEFVDQLEQLRAEPDLLIVATNSNVRHEVCRSALPQLRPRFTVLEKVLFQQLSHYDEIGDLIAGLGLKVWVNHPSRTWPFYRMIKARVSGASFIHLQVAGGDWGLACNSLHYLDTLSFITDSQALHCSTERLSPAPAPAKRAGFYEFFGSLSGSVGNATFDLYCGQSSAPSTLVLTTDKACFRVDATHGHYQWAQADSWHWEDVHEPIARFQSDATADLLNELVEYGQCGLPSYQNAATLHRPFIAALLEHMERNGFATNGICPIT